MKNNLLFTPEERRSIEDKFQDAILYKAMEGAANRLVAQPTSFFLKPAELFYHTIFTIDYLRAHCERENILYCRNNLWQELFVYFSTRIDGNRISKEDIAYLTSVILESVAFFLTRVGTLPQIHIAGEIKTVMEREYPGHNVAFDREFIKGMEYLGQKELDIEAQRYFTGKEVYSSVMDEMIDRARAEARELQGQMAGGQTATKPERKSTLPKIRKSANGKPQELMTFSKRGILEANLQLLYSQMVKDCWIDKDTKVDDFLDLFSGRRSDCTIIWSGTYGKGTLVHFFKVIESQELISIPKGFTLPNILMGHFVDKEGNFLTNLDKGDSAAEKAGPEMQEYINILELSAGQVARRAKSQDDDEFGYDDAINEKDIKSEGMSIHKR